MINKDYCCEVLWVAALHFRMGFAAMDVGYLDVSSGKHGNYIISAIKTQEATGDERWMATKLRLFISTSRVHSLV